MIDNRKNPFPWMIIGGGALLILAGFAWVILNQSYAALATPIPATVKQVQRVSLVDAIAAIEAGTAVFIDVRDSQSFNSSHIPGALSIPISDLANRLNELYSSNWIITYCT